MRAPFPTPSPGVCSPVFPSTAHRFPNPENENRYPRYFNTPNAALVADKVAALVVGSGMAAVSTCLRLLLAPGDHAVSQADLYGGTRLLLDELQRHGVRIEFARTPQEFATCTRPQTRLYYAESPSNLSNDLPARGA